MKTNFKKQALSIVLSLAMVVGVGVTTFASGPKPGVPQLAVEKPKELKIKKVLNLPTSGVKTPQQTFTFTFTKVSFNGKTDDTEKNQMPEINKNLTTSYTNADNTDQDNTIPGKQVIKLTGNTLEGVTFPKVGQYTYTVAETAGATEDMTYSKAQYTVSIFTETKKDKIVVKTIQIKQDKTDEGTTPTGEQKKTEYNLGTGDTGVGNNFVFNNNYDKKGGNDNPKKQGDPEDTDKQGFTLKKLVAGENVNNDEKFEFTLTVTKPEGTHSKDEEFSYKIASANADTSAETKVKYGTAFKVSLKHGERLVFGKVLLGSKVKVEETDAKGYISTVNTDSKLNGTVVTLDQLKADATNQKVIGEEGDNFVTFTNTQQTAVGFILNNLPFIVLVAFAGFGILFFVKNKKDKDEEEQRA